MNRCPECGKDRDLVGIAHLCVAHPRIPVDIARKVIARSKPEKATKPKTKKRVR